MICPACDGAQFSRVADLGSAKLDRCRRCGLIVNTRVGSREPSDYYGEEYDGFYENYYRKFRKRQFKEVVRRMDAVQLPSTRVLDVGCSYGWFLDAAAEKGFTAVGAEPSSKVFQRLTAENRHEVHHCGVEGIEGISGTFGLITMWNVFEHIEDPGAALQLIRKKLDDDGVILLCVPDYSGLITRMSFLAHTLSLGKLKGHLLKLYQMDNDFPHLFHYSRKSLELILQKHGFQPFMAWGQDIVDSENLGERIEGYAGARTPLKYLIVTALRALQKAARVTGLQDELVVLARKA